MRAVFGLVLVLGMALAGAAVYMIQDYIAQTVVLLQKEREFNAKAGKLVEVNVFNKKLEYGDALTPDDVQLIYWPEKALPESIFRDLFKKLFQTPTLPKTIPWPFLVSNPYDSRDTLIFIFLFSFCSD